MEFFIARASPEQFHAAFAIVEEYYLAASVMARDSEEEFKKLYFADGSGVWLALENSSPIGCIALRGLSNFPPSGEIKRLYVRPSHRRAGVAQALLDALETGAIAAGYAWLYLDSAPGMEQAVRFYRRNGFKDCAPYNHNPQAVIFLRKKLG